MVLLSLHGSAAGHARFDRSKNSTFLATAWPSSDLEASECTGDVGNAVALRNLGMGVGLTFTNPWGVRSTPGTRPPEAAPQ